MWTYSTPRISDVFLKNPVIRPTVTLEEIRERVYSDLNIKENDNIILLTFKVVNDRPNGDYWVWERDGIYPDDITETLDDCLGEFNRIFGNVNKGDYFKSMMTAEIIESDYQDKPLVRCKWHILINTRNIGKEDIGKEDVGTGNINNNNADDFYVSTESTKTVVCILLALSLTIAAYMIVHTIYIRKRRIK